MRAGSWAACLPARPQRRQSCRWQRGPGMPWRKLKGYLAISDSARYNLRSIIPIWAVVILAILIVGLTSEPFRSAINVSNLLSVMAPLIIVSVGQALVILLGGIDLSVGSVMSLIT